MYLSPKLPLGLARGDATCEEALDARINALLDEACAAGWTAEEVAAAVMESANNWYFRRANLKTGHAIGRVPRQRNQP